MKYISILILILSVFFFGYVVYGQVTKKPAPKPLPAPSEPLVPAKPTNIVDPKLPSSQNTPPPIPETLPQSSPAEPSIPQQNKGNYDQQIDAYRI
jgi:hypothetical protein